MYSLVEPAADHELPPLDDLISGRPARWAGLAVQWRSDADPVPVLIARLTRADGNGLCLCGARYELSDALVNGDDLGPGYFVEYFVVTGTSADGWVLHRLLQRGGVTYIDREGADDYVPAETVDDPARLSAPHPPVWKPSEAVWPTYAGTLMRFIGQVELPATELTRRHLTWDEQLYLFEATDDGSDCFTLVTQDPDAQTAEEHYASEG